MTERKLRQVSRRLVSAREELRVAEEQLAHMSEVAEDLRVRSLVSDSPQDGVDYGEAQAASSAMARHRSDLVRAIANLEVEQDELLDRLTADRR